MSCISLWALGLAVVLACVAAQADDVRTQSIAFVERHYSGETPHSAYDEGTTSAAAGVWNGDVLEDYSHSDGHGSIKGHARATAGVGALAVEAVLDYTDLIEDMSGHSRESFQSEASAMYAEWVFIDHPDADVWVNHRDYTINLKFHISGTATRTGGISSATQLVAYNIHLNSGEDEGPGHEQIFYSGNSPGSWDEDVFYGLWGYDGTPVEIEFTLRTYANNTNLWDYAGSGTATMDFFHTMTLSEIQVLDEEWETVATFDAAGTLTAGDPSFSFARVPEPTTLTLLALAAAAALARRRR